MFLGTSLYYFTTNKDYFVIARQGFIDLQDSFLLPHGGKSNRRNKLILLTSDAKPDLENLGLPSAGPMVRLTISNNKDFISWKDYVAANHLTKDWCAKVESGKNPQLWYIASRRILSSEITEAAVSDVDLAVDMMSIRRECRQHNN